MKTWRVCVVLLLAALLPMRGAVAAMMMCPPASMAAHVDHAAPHDHAAMMAHAHDASHVVHACGPCGDCCAAAMVFGALPGVRAPALFGIAAFPTPRAPTPSFLSDGLERPPRRC